jgi:hypothetical protein
MTERLFLNISSMILWRAAPAVQRHLCRRERMTMRLGNTDQGMTERLFLNISSMILWRAAPAVQRHLAAESV